MPKSLLHINKIFLVFLASVTGYGFYSNPPTDILRALAQLVPLVVLPLTLYAAAKNEKSWLMAALLANAALTLFACGILFFGITPGVVTGRIVLFVFTIPFLANMVCLLRVIRALGTSA